jgi:hypothetical protein
MKNQIKERLAKQYLLTGYGNIAVTGNKERQIDIRDNTQVKGKRYRGGYDYLGELVDAVKEFEFVLRPKSVGVVSTENYTRTKAKNDYKDAFVDTDFILNFFDARHDAESEAVGFMYGALEKLSEYSGKQIYVIAHTWKDTDMTIEHFFTPEKTVKRLEQLLSEETGIKAATGEHPEKYLDKIHKWEEGGLLENYVVKLEIIEL